MWIFHLAKQGLPSLLGKPNCLFSSLRQPWATCAAEGFGNILIEFQTGRMDCTTSAGDNHIFTAPLSKKKKMLCANRTQV